MANREDSFEKDTVFDREPKNSMSGAVGAGFFTGSMWAVCMLLVCTIVGIAFSGFNRGLAICLSLIIAGIAGGILQQVWFNYRATRRFTYGMRLFLFGITYLVVLAACALMGNWLPAGNPYAWITFVVIYLVVFAVMTVCIGHSLTVRSIEYKKQLDAYKRNRKADDE